MNQNWAEKMASGFVTAEKLAPAEPEPVLRWDEYDLLAKPRTDDMVWALLRRRRANPPEPWREIAIFESRSAADRVLELLRADHLVAEPPVG